MPRMAVKEIAAATSSPRAPMAGATAAIAELPQMALPQAIKVARRFGISDTEFAYIKARHVTAAKRNPYDVLGIEPSISNEGLKSHYRKLVSDNHPDKLIARGVPKEFVAIATEKIAVINEAYGEIAKERGI